MQFFSSLPGLLVAGWCLAATAMASPMESGALTFQDNTAYESYIGNKIYQKVYISDYFGKLVQESYIGEYTPKKLADNYYDRICQGVYWFNCSYNLHNLTQDVGINLANESGLFGVKLSGVKAYQVVYTSKGMDNKGHNVSGAMLIPQTPELIKGIVILYHYTVLNKNNVPSNYGKDEFNLSKTAAGAFASAGYIVLMPDYPGLGVDQAAVHPYMLYPLVNALSGIYMLKLLPQIQPAIKYKLINKHIPLYLSGYSEGGSYALWAAKLIQDNPGFMETYGLTLRKTVAIAGAYNLSKVTVPFLFKEVNKVHEAPYFVEDDRVAAFVKPGLVANVLNSYAHFNLANNESMAFSPPFFNCELCEVDDKTYSISGLLQAPANELAKFKMLYKAANSVGYGDENHSISLLTNQQLFASQNFKDTLEAADIYNWQATTPVTFLTFEYDSIVPRLNAETAYIAMSKQKSRYVKIIQVPNQNYQINSYLPFSDMNVDHPQGVPVMLLYARQEFTESQDAYVTSN